MAQNDLTSSNITCLVLLLFLRKSRLLVTILFRLETYILSCLVVNEDPNAESLPMKVTFTDDEQKET